MKPVFVIAGILLTAGVCYYGVTAGYRFVRNSSFIDGGVAERAWSDEVTLNGVITVEGPFPFKKASDRDNAGMIEMFSEVEMYLAEGGPFSMSYASGLPRSGDWTAPDWAPSEPFLPGEDYAGVKAIRGYKNSHIKVLDGRATESLIIHQVSADRFERRDCMFLQGKYACSMSLEGPEGDPRLAPLWERMLATVRKAGQPKVDYEPGQSETEEGDPENPGPEPSIQPGAPALPPGMERISYGPKE